MRKPIPEDEKRRIRPEIKSCGFVFFTVSGWFKSSPYPVGSLPGRFVVVSAGGDSYYEIVFPDNAGKIEIAFVLIAADVDGDSHAFADAVNILVGLMIVRGGDDQIGIVDVLSLVLFFQDQDLSLRLEFQKLRIDFGSDDGQIFGEIHQCADPAFGDGACADDDDFFMRNVHKHGKIGSELHLS